jgi:hypothetical protein
MLAGLNVKRAPAATYRLDGAPVGAVAGVGTGKTSTLPHGQPGCCKRALRHTGCCR